MKLKEIIDHPLIICAPEATVQEVAKKMKSSNVGAIPIVGNSKVIGLITDRDITLRITAEGGNPAETPVHEVMTRNIHTCFEDDTVEKAANLMERKNIRRCVVLNHQNQPVGIVSIDDLACHATTNKRAGRVIRRVANHQAHHFST